MRLFNRRRVLSRRHWAGYGVAGSVLTPLPGTQLAEGIRGVPLKTDPLSELRQNPLVTDIQEKIEIDKEGFMKTVLVVCTTVKLHCLDPNFSEAQRTSLEEAVKAQFEKAIDRFDRVDIVQVAAK